MLTTKPCVLGLAILAATATAALAQTSKDQIAALNPIPQIHETKQQRDARMQCLREAAAGLFTIGVGISDRIPERPADWPLLTAQFSAVTPENCLKPDPVQVAEGKFNFTRADAFVDFAASQPLQVVGHCLVWAKDDRTPPWFFRDGTNAASRELLLRA